MLLSLVPADLTSHRCNAPLPVLESRITSGIGPRPALFSSPKKRGSKRTEIHWGIDISAPDGTPVRAVFDGYVSRAFRARNGDLNVEVRSRRDKRRFATKYHHLSRLLVHDGQQIKRGDILGIIGDTGAAFGVHLHLEMNWLKGKSRTERSIDPLPFLCRYPLPKMEHSQCSFEGRAEDGSARFRCPRQAVLPWRRNDAPLNKPQAQASPLGRQKGGQP